MKYGIGMGSPLTAWAFQAYLEEVIHSCVDVIKDNLKNYKYTIRDIPDKRDGLLRGEICVSMEALAAQGR